MFDVWRGAEVALHPGQRIVKLSRLITLQVSMFQVPHGVSVNVSSSSGRNLIKLHP